MRSLRLTLVFCVGLVCFTGAYLYGFYRWDRGYASALAFDYFGDKQWFVDLFYATTDKTALNDPHAKRLTIEAWRKKLDGKSRAEQQAIIAKDACNPSAFYAGDIPHFPKDALVEGDPEVVDDVFIITTCTSGKYLFKSVWHFWGDSLGRVTLTFTKIINPFHEEPPEIDHLDDLYGGRNISDNQKLTFVVERSTMTDGTKRMVLQDVDWQFYPRAILDEESVCIPYFPREPFQSPDPYGGWGRPDVIIEPITHGTLQIYYHDEPPFSLAVNSYESPIFIPGCSFDYYRNGNLQLASYTINYLPETGYAERNFHHFDEGGSHESSHRYSSNPAYSLRQILRYPHWLKKP